MSENPTPVLEIQGLTAERPRDLGESDLGLRGVSLQLFPGEVFVLAGEVGSGKSLVANLIADLGGPGVKILNGKILVEGTDLVPMNRQRRRNLRRKKIGVMVREARTQMNPGKTVRQWLRESGRMGREGESAITAKSWSDYFYAVGIVEPERILETAASDLNSLTLKRLVIMKTLMSGARILICDDVTAELDRIAEAQFFELISTMREEHQLSVILTMSSLRGIGHVADRIAVFYEGGILETGVARDILDRPEFAYTREFRSCSPRLSHMPGMLDPISREAVAEAEKAVHRNAAPVEELIEIGSEQERSDA